MAKNICIDAWTNVALFLRTQERLLLMDTLSRDHRDIVTSLLPVDPEDTIIEDYLPAFKKLTCEYDLVNLLKMCCRYDAINCAKWLYKKHGFALRHQLCIDLRKECVYFDGYEGSLMVLTKDAFHRATIYGSLKILKWLWSLGYCVSRNSDNFIERSIEYGHKEQIDWFNGLADRKRDHYTITIMFKSPRQYLRERLDRSIRFVTAVTIVIFLYVMSYLIFFGLILNQAHIGNLRNFSIIYVRMILEIIFNNHNT